MNRKNLIRACLFGKMIIARFNPPPLAGHWAKACGKHFEFLDFSKNLLFSTSNLGLARKFLIPLFANKIPPIPPRKIS